MLDKLQKIKDEYQAIEKELSHPDISSDPQKLRDLSKKQASLSEYMGLIDEYEKVIKSLQEDEIIIDNEKDSELVKMAEEEIEKLSAQKINLEKELQVLLLPKDPNDEKDVIMEIRAGVGGDEAALFAADLYRMYSRYAEDKGYRIELITSSRTGIGGLKEIIFSLKGNSVYKKLKYESGVHRVQRVPETEKNGRIHTSTITVAVLPEAEEVELELDPKDLKIDVYRSSGPGGQSVNTTDSAVRVTHLPTGLIVSCQDEKSQHKNKDKALKVLRSRLLYEKQEQQRKEQGDARKSQIGTGERSEKIRTYNYPQDRITDHRIKFSTNNIQKLLDGNLDVLINKLFEEDQKKKMASTK